MFTDDGTGVLSPGVVAAFGVIGAIAALVGIASTLIGIIIKVIKTIRDGKMASNPLEWGEGGEGVVCKAHHRQKM